MKVNEIHTIYWTETVYEDTPGLLVKTRVGTRRMMAKVVVTVDTELAANSMGRRAAESKGGKCVDGLLSVKRLTGPVEVK